MAQGKVQLKQSVRALKEPDTQQYKEPDTRRAALPFALPCVFFGSGGRSCIAFAAGRKYLHAVFMREPIAMGSLELGKIDLDPAQLKGKPYPVRRAARLYLKSQIAKTDRAKRVLRRLAKGDTEVLA